MTQMPPSRTVAVKDERKARSADDPPYDHPPVGVRDIEHHWRGYYAEEARAMSPGELTCEFARTAKDVATCEEALAVACERIEEIGRGDGLPWVRQQDRQWAVADRDRLLARLARLTGRRSALATERERGNGQ